MMPRGFSKGEAIRFGWEVTKRHFWFFLLTFIIFGVTLSMRNIISFVKPETSAQAGLAIAIVILQAIVQMFLTLGLVRISLKFADNEQASLQDLFGATFRQVNSYFAAGILGTILFIIGTVLLVIPGIIVSIRLSMATYLIMDQNLGPIEAMRRSWAITEGAGWNLFLFAILVVLLNVLGFIALVVGFFWSAPTGVVAFAFIYRKLQSIPAMVPASAPAPA